MHPTKLIVAIIQNRDADETIAAFNREGYTVTRTASTGGFLRAGNTTLLMGVEDAQVDRAIAVLHKHCHQRTHFKPLPATGFESGASLHHYAEVTVGGATVFVLDIEHFEQI